MKTKLTAIAFASLAVVMLVGNAKAGILTFTASQMDAMTVQEVRVNNVIVLPSVFTTGGLNIPPNHVTLSPTYSDGTPAMSGKAGATGSWSTAVAGFGSTGQVFLGLNALGVFTQFGTNDFSSGGFTTLTVQAFNDNNSIWGYDIWIETLLDGRVSTSPILISPGSSAPVALDLTLLSAGSLANVTGIGLSMHGIFTGAGGMPTAGDSFHASWSPLPEPVSVAVWSTFCAAAAGVGLVRRRRK